MIKIYKFVVMILTALRVMVFFVVGVLPHFIIRIFSPKLAERYLYIDFRATARFILFLLGVKVEISGHTENCNLKNVPLVYISNHTSLLDVCAYVGVLKIVSGYVAKKELMYVPIANLAIKAMHGVFIDRKSLKKSVESINKAAESVKFGHPVLIFPEGTRSKTGKMAEFKKGAFRLASKSEAVMVPLVIKNIRPALEDRKKLFKKTVAKICVGEICSFKECKDREEIQGLVSGLEEYMNSVYNSL